MIKALYKLYGETPKSIGITGEYAIAEILVSPTGTWTIIETPPIKGAMTCLVKSGHSWEDMPLGGAL